MSEIADIALLSLATTPGLIRSDASFAELVRAAGATCAVVPVEIGASGRLRRQIALTDLVEAVAARRAARRLRGRTLVFSTITAALLQRPRAPYAIRFDATASLNRPGPSGAWQRRRERRVLAGARVLLPLTEAAARALPDTGDVPVVPVPIPIERLTGAHERDITAVTYAGYPRKRGLELVLAAWAAAGPPGGRLVVGGADAEKGRRWLARTGVPEPPGVEWAGALERGDWLALVRRARVFLNGSRWEDYGLAPLEALSAGALLATVPTPGPYAALPLARSLAAELVAESVDADALAGSLAAALALDRGDYARRADALLGPFREEAALATLRDRVLPLMGI